MSPARVENQRTGHGFPRVSGDEPKAPEIPAPRAAFSPRERG